MNTIQEQPASNRAIVESPEAAWSGNMQEVDWRDFRDHIATADKDGRRRWLYPKAPSGIWHRRRAWFASLLILIMFAGP